MMSIARKCPDCHTWNEANDYCSGCGKLLNYVMEREKEDNLIQRRRAELPTGAIDAWLAKLKASNNGLARITYYALNSIWVVLVIFLTFIYAIIAFVAG